MDTNRRNDRAFAATLAAMATALCLLPLVAPTGRTAPAPTAATTVSTAAALQATASAAVTVLEPVVITSQRAARQARLAQDERASVPKI